jgi:hypothetical protein
MKTAVASPAGPGKLTPNHNLKSFQFALKTMKRYKKTVPTYIVAT